MEEVDLYGSFTASQIQNAIMLTQQEVLGVTRDSSKAEIKKAYHKVNSLTYFSRLNPNFG